MQDKQKVTLYLPPELHKKLKIQAALDSETMTDIAQRAIVFYLSHPDVVEEHSISYGQSHRVYACPDCTSPVAIQGGEMVSLRNQSGLLVEERSVSKAQVGSVNADSQGEGELVPC